MAAPRRPLASLALLALLLPALPGSPTGAEAQGVPAVQLEYTVNVLPNLLDQGKVEVWWKATGFRDRVSAFCLQTDRHEYAIEELGPSTVWENHPQDSDPAKGRVECPQGYRALVQGQDEVQASFLLDVRKPAFSACGCEFNSFLGPAWGVVKAEALAIPFSYAFFAPQPAFHATVRFLLPEGWSAEAPLGQVGPNVFELPGDGAPLPRGFFALGSFTRELRDERASIGREFVYVRLAQELRGKDTLFEYLKKATPYYQSVYGNVTGHRILVISAGAPMFTGGLGSTDSLFVHHNSSSETIAHEYAHVWQRFQTVDNPAGPGGSSIWLNEGDADLHGALSRVVTETQPGFTFARLNAEFKDAYDEHVAEPEMQQPLNAAAYGGTFEQVAYKKGLFTLVFLEQEMRRLTRDAAGLNDVLRELNKHYDEVVVERPGEKRLTNDDALGVVNRVVQRHANLDMLNFFRLYVWGNTTDPCPGKGSPDPGCWPPYREVPPEVPIVFEGLQVEPEVVEAGGSIAVRVLATNVRSGTEARSVELLIDDRTADRRTISVGSLQTVPVSFAVPGGGPGPHTARVAYLRADYRVLTAAALVVESIRPTAPPQAGVAFELAVELRNAGETPAQATVDAVVEGQQRLTEVRVPGAGTARATLPFLVAREGPASAEVVVRWGNQTLAASAILTIGPRDRDDDGVPDRDDAFPDNPRLSEPGVVNDVRNRLPGLGPLAAMAAMAAAVALGRRARR